MIVNVIGATGLVGTQLVRQLAESSEVKKIRIFVRKPTGFVSEKIEEHVIQFGEMDSWKNLVTGDVLFSALGTTVKQAGSKGKEFEVDFTYNLNFARAARDNQIPTYVLVSSVGANSKSAIFYSRMKGQLDEAVQDLGFQNTIILRPSVLDGQRKGKRAAENLAIKVGNVVTKFIFKKYRPIKDTIVAKAMIKAAMQSQTGAAKIIYTADEIFSLAGEQ